ncbi:hypothetical protein NHX12_011484 [Muraenolepis orangiensis]|uniref:Uncharacterized protein n=1 Tax=Muraenolepis orangiensis TaxID=630683 RepID=A0A9Q0I6Q9_9TELE|nr:hypothetical protein NHX12_011484 [Muraenolepis orangiensis]
MGPRADIMEPRLAVGPRGPAALLPPRRGNGCSVRCAADTCRPNPEQPASQWEAACVGAPPPLGNELIN